MVTEERIVISQRKIQESIVGIKLFSAYSVKNKIMGVRKRIRLMKWQWAGHTYRIKTNRWTKCLTEWGTKDPKKEERETI